MVKEARVRLESGKVGAVHVECLDFMTVGAPGPCVSAWFEYDLVEGA